MLSEKCDAIEAHGKVIGAFAESDIACRFGGVKETPNLIG